MGNLTDDMTRLRGEVDALRSARGALIQELTRGAMDLTTAVAAMRADFTSAHAAMAKQSRGARGTFVASVIDEVSSLLGAFSRDRDNMARKGRDNRGTFLAEMRREVMGLCKDTADDLMGARLVWRGERPGKSRPVPMKKEPAAVKPVSPPPEPAPKMMVVATEIKSEKPPVKVKKPPRKEAKKAVAAPEFKAKKKMVAAPEAPAVESPRVKAPPLVGASKPAFQKSKGKSRMGEKTAKATTKAKRGRK